MTRSRAVVLGAAAVVLTAGAVTAVVATGNAPDTTDDAPAAVTTPVSEPTIFGNGMAVAPHRSVEDIVGHAERVVVLTAVDEREEPERNVPPERAAAGETRVIRHVTYRVDHVLWEAPDAPERPTTFEVINGGWVTKKDERFRLVIRGTAWQELGEQFVVPVGHYREWYEPFWPAGYPLRGSVVTLAPGQSDALAERLDGLHVDEVARLFADADREAGTSHD